MKRTLLPPFTEALSSAIVRAAEEAWNTRNPAQVAQAYSKHSLWRNRDTFLVGHDQIIEFLTRKSSLELYCRLMKELWACTDNRISVRFECEWQHANAGHGFRTHGKEHRAFDAEGYMTRRDMSANDIPIRSSERRIGVSIETRGL